MKLTPEQWREILNRPETKRMVQHALTIWERNERRRFADSFNTPWWLAAIWWTLIATVPVGFVCLLQLLERAHS